MRPQTISGTYCWFDKGVDKADLEAQYGVAKSNPIRPAYVVAEYVGASLLHMLENGQIGISLNTIGLP
jgi:hypothetical protein